MKKSWEKKKKAKGKRTRKGFKEWKCLTHTDSVSIILSAHF